MKIAIIGVRGIPVIYSGFETFAEELATRLVKRGNKVTVYCRKAYVNLNRKKYKGVDLVVLPSIGDKNLETILHSGISTIYALFGEYDVIYYLGVGSAIYCLLPRIFGTKTVINVDGLDWKREKWSWFARYYLSVSEKLALWFTNKVVTDSKYIQKYYEEVYGYKAPYIPYGYYESENPEIEILNKYNLKKNDYFVWVGRLVPDNRLEVFTQAFKRCKTDKKCVVIGDNYNDDSYKNKMMKLCKKDERIVFVGFQDRGKYEALVSQAFCYVETKKSGGTHPSLVEALGFGSLMIVNSHPANKGVVGDGGVYYNLEDDADSLFEALVRVEVMKKTTIMKKRKQNKIRAEKKYSWEVIVDNYEILFESLL